MRTLSGRRGELRRGGLRPAPRARRGRTPGARAWPSAVSAISASSAASRSHSYLSSAMICATSAVVRPSGNSGRISAASSAGARRAEARVEVGDADVVGLEGLEAARLEGEIAVGELQARRGEAHAAVGVGRLALELGRAALGRAGLVAVLLEERSVSGSAAASMIASGSMPPTQAIASRSSFGSSRYRVDVNWANWSARKTANSCSGASRLRGDDDAAHRPGAVDALARLGRERHAAVAELAVPTGLAAGRVAALLVDGAVLGQADHHESPVELVAVAPPESGDGRGGRPRPRAAGVGEVGHLNRHDH